MPANRSHDALFELQKDIEQQQLRVLLLIHEVSAVDGTGNKLDGLTKLAKLDFLCRYRDIAPSVEQILDGKNVDDVSRFAQSEDPMIRHKFGPWDDRYYPVVGALVGRGLITYLKGQRGSVAMRLTKEGRNLVEKLETEQSWADVGLAYRAVAQTFGLESGNRLKDAIYRAIPEALDVPHRTVMK